MDNPPPADAIKALSGAATQEAIEWLRSAASEREKGVQHDKEHHRKSACPFNEVAARKWATLSGLTLERANLILAHLAISDPAAIAAAEARETALRGLVAILYCASGCSCCRDDGAWYAAANKLGEAFGIPPYEDGSGPNWYAARDEYVAILAKLEAGS